MDIAFAQNYTNLYEIDITPQAAYRTYVRLGAGISSVEWEGNEEIGQDAYYDGDGFTSSDVTGGQLVASVEGHRRYGDPAQDYIASLLLVYGEGRKTNFRWTAPNGNVIEGECTIANIAPQAGDANTKSDFSFEIHMNGLPKFTKGNADTFPEQITATAVTVVEGATASIETTITPTTAAPAVVYAVDNDEVATVDSDGTVHGIAEGKTEISIKSCVRPMVVAVVEVTVSKATAKTQG